MTYGICKLSAIAMRKEPRHGSEMVNQLLYNETYTVLDKVQEWVLVQTDFDPYQGWIQAKQFAEIGEEEYKVLKAKKIYLTNKPIIAYHGRFLSMGTSLYETHPDAIEMPTEFHPEMMVDYAKLLLGAPYLWGGRTVMGIDCSGLVQMCARLSGRVLPRDASQQIREGELVYFLQETQPGDLAFFGEEDGHITHVGIVMGGEQVIHCSGQVRIDYLDQTGIFNKECNEHTHHLQAVKRLG
jgi:cell wall-associated NlpC family hydrolase